MSASPRSRTGTGSERNGTSGGTGREEKKNKQFLLLTNERTVDAIPGMEEGMQPTLNTVMPFPLHHLHGHIHAYSQVRKVENRHESVWRSVEIE